MLKSNASTRTFNNLSHTTVWRPARTTLIEAAPEDGGVPKMNWWVRSQQALLERRSLCHKRQAPWEALTRGEGASQGSDARAVQMRCRSDFYIGRENGLPAGKPFVALVPWNRDLSRKRGVREAKATKLDD
jgi:hypothetical protein